jgi:hypothetical protein
MFYFAPDLSCSVVVCLQEQLIRIGKSYSVKIVLLSGNYFNLGWIKHGEKNSKQSVFFVNCLNVSYVTEIRRTLAVHLVSKKIHLHVSYCNSKVDSNFFKQ